MSTDVRAFLDEMCALPGVPGYEERTAEFVMQKFAPYADEVYVDKLYNAYARLGDKGPRVLLSAHQDEIGLIVTRIDSRGMLRITRNGGVDPRILPGLEVTVHTRSGPVYGVVGATPPHFQQTADRTRAYKMEELFVDIGYSASKVCSMVQQGDMVTMAGPIVSLENNRIAGKTMDDRACVAMLWDAAKRLAGRKLNCTAVFVASTQEEVGTRGAQVAAYSQKPDINIAVDVTHAPTPDSDKFETFPMDAVGLTVGPNIHPALLKRLRDVAKRNRVTVAIDPEPGMTGTDARAMQIARDGVPTALIELPLKYMHTTVETISLDTLQEGGRLIAEFLAELDESWEEWLCF